MSGAVAAPPPGAAGSYYEAHRKIYPREIQGRYALWRTVAVWVLLGCYYLLPWLTLHGRQAVLFDLPARKFWIFGLVLWPQDFIFLTWILVLLGLSLFFFTALAGRLWCAYACPQTVWTEAFLWMERLAEGSRSVRMKLDAAPWSLHKLARKGAKQLLWVSFALWTGFTFVGFFTPIVTLAHDVLNFDLGPWATFWICFYGFATYGNAGLLREQVCKYMCPYARFQSAMFDRDTLIITYDTARGEPRGSRRREAVRGSGGLGDCIDCTWCVQVCPTGIDIRQGLQYECIACAACIDACDQVMDRLDYPRGLIRYTTTNALAQQLTRGQIWRHVLRPRVLVYSTILGGICVAMIVSLGLRVPLKLDVIRDRGTFAREVENEQVENVYRLQVMNTGPADATYLLQASGLPGIAVASESRLSAPALSTQTYILRLRAPEHGTPPGANRILIALTSTADERVQVHEKSVFFGLRP